MIANVASSVTPPDLTDCEASFNTDIQVTVVQRELNPGRNDPFGIDDPTEVKNRDFPAVSQTLDQKQNVQSPSLEPIRESLFFSVPL